MKFGIYVLLSVAAGLSAQVNLAFAQQAGLDQFCTKVCDEIREPGCRAEQIRLCKAPDPEKPEVPSGGSDDKRKPGEIVNTTCTKICDDTENPGCRMEQERLCRKQPAPTGPIFKPGEIDPSTFCKKLCNDLEYPGCTLRQRELCAAHPHGKDVLRAKEDPEKVDPKVAPDEHGDGNDQVDPKTGPKRHL